MRVSHLTLQMRFLRGILVRLSLDQVALDANRQALFVAEMNRCLEQARSKL